MRATREQLERDGILQAAERTTDPGRLRELRAELGDLAVTAYGRRGFKVDEKAVKEDRCGDGKFLIFSTNPEFGAEEMFKIYFQRDEIEKAFRTLKGELSLGPIRYHRRDRIDAYTTIIYLAYLLWSLAQQRLGEKYPSLTVTQALKLVGDIHAVRFQSGKRVLEWTTKRTAEQNKILKLVGAQDLMPSD
jgi:transposase